MAKKMKMTKKSNGCPIALFLTDPHLTKDNGELVKDIFRQAIGICKDKGISTIIVGGDIFTNRSGQPLSCLTFFGEIIEMVREANRLLIVIPGNHDKTDANDDKSYLDVFRYHPSLRVISSAKMTILGGAGIGLIPYFGEEKWMEEFEGIEGVLEAQLIEGDLDPDATKILITHMGVEGVRNNDGTEVVSPIKPKNFKNWDKVLIGHYHDASKLGDNVIYTGSAYQGNYGENIVDKGFTVIYSDGVLEFIPSKFPKYIKEVINVEDGDTLRNVIEKYGEPTDNYVRLIIRGKKVDAKKINISELSAMGFDVKYEAVEDAEAVELAESEAIVSMDKKSIFKDFLKFCSENDIKGDKLQYGIKLMKSL